jgi:hypothetical protein
MRVHANWSRSNPERRLRINLHPSSFWRGSQQLEGSSLPTTVIEAYAGQGGSPQLCCHSVDERFGCSGAIGLRPKSFRSAIFRSCKLTSLASSISTAELNSEHRRTSCMGLFALSTFVDLSAATRCCEVSATCQDTNLPPKKHLNLLRQLRITPLLILLLQSPLMEKSLWARRIV